MILTDEQELKFLEVYNKITEDKLVDINPSDHERKLWFETREQFLGEVVEILELVNEAQLNLVRLNRDRG